MGEDGCKELCAERLQQLGRQRVRPELEGRDCTEHRDCTAQLASMFLELTDRFVELIHDGAGQGQPHVPW